MKKENETHTEESPTQEHPRRRLLKALTAGGAAAAVMPSQWTTPALKSVVLPAHAQTTPGALGCGIQGWFWVTPSGSDGACFSMSANVKLDNFCSGPGTVRVFNSSGDAIATCASTAGGAPTASFSCSVDGSGAPADEGDLVTFVAEFDGGCSCTFVRTAI